MEEGNYMLSKLNNLIEVKKIIALLLTFTFIVLSLTGIITGESFTNIFLIIVGFYFGQSTVKSANKSNEA